MCGSSLIHESVVPDAGLCTTLSEVTLLEKLCYKQQNPIFLSADSIHLLDLHKTAVQPLIGSGKRRDWTDRETQVL